MQWWACRRCERTARASMRTSATQGSRQHEHAEVPARGRPRAVESCSPRSRLSFCEQVRAANQNTRVKRGRKCSLAANHSGRNSRLHKCKWPWGARVAFFAYVWLFGACSGGDVTTTNEPGQNEQLCTFHKNKEQRSLIKPTGAAFMPSPPMPTRSMRRHSSVVAPSALYEHEAWKHSLFREVSRGGASISIADLQTLLRKLHVPDSRAEEIFRRVDADGNGEVSYEEFSAYVDHHEFELRSAFAAIDTDGSGSISAEEIDALLSRLQMSCSAERRDEILKLLDVDGDGTISYEEYRSFFALLDPEDLLRSLDDSASFGDLPASMMADLFKKPATPASPPEAAAAAPSAAVGVARGWALQLLPGGLAGAMAQTIVQPVETLKVRLQAESAGAAPPRYGSMANALKLVTAEEGILALWKGMAPSALRELSYSTLRFGLYRPIKKALGAGTPRDTPLWKMMAAGGAAGGIASFIASPTDLLKTRMQADAGAVPKPMSAHVSEIFAKSGMLGFWRGASATVVRAVTLGAVKMASYDASKLAAEDNLGLKKGTTSNTLTACLVSSAFVVFSSAPIDFLRTQMMAGESSGGMLSIASTAVRAHGPLVLWRGWVPQYMRILPYGTLQFIFMERIANALGASMT